MDNEVRWLIKEIMQLLQKMSDEDIKNYQKEVGDTRHVHRALLNKNCKTYQAS
ncbi:MAG: hypothetical protein DIAAKJNI_00111 [Candidatus Argoarchaeum ethanivorans]|uniref:Uncharacterized protein n=1 Tax=Candidatus Argoarchaeum ethanivorans TaxID=2608793 RepID=A0A811T776_9EURY|nr:MAG: hypothetical protein DIAAKJNI_00111 [Candidatus Argoarchaeum ethanivorans]